MMKFFVLLSLFCFMFIFLSNSVLKMMIYFLGSLILMSTMMDSWYNYFIILTYLGGLFILMVYMSTLSFSRESFSFVGILNLVFMFLTHSRLFFDTGSFFLVVSSFYFSFVVLLLLIIVFVLFLISFLLPSGISSRGNV